MSPLSPLGPLLPGPLPLGAIFWPLLFGLGVYLVVTGQPIGRPKPSLVERFRRLDIDERLRLQAMQGDSKPFFAIPLLEAVVRPLLDDAGRLLQETLARLGLRDAKSLERKLRLVRPGVGPTQFFGEKVLAGLLGAAFPPLFNLLGVQPFGTWPAWLSLVTGAAGYLLPEGVLERRLAARRTLALMELPSLLDLLTLCASAGLALEQALREVAVRSNGIVAQELQQAAREMAVGSTLADALDALATRNAVPELTRAVAQLRAAHEQGIPLVQALSVQAEALRERQRLKIVEAGGRATVLMVVPVALLILPTLFVILLFPAVLRLMWLSG